MQQRSIHERSGRWSVTGLAFLYVLPMALLAGVIETTLAQPGAAPSLIDLLYGANLHLLLAVAALLLTRLLFWRRTDRSFPFLALGAVLCAELALVVPYWLGVAPWAPPFGTWRGRFFVAATVVVGMLLAVAVGRMLLRYASAARRRQGAPTAAGAVGLLVALALLLVNASLLYRSWPRAESVAVRSPAQDLARDDVIIILVDTLRRDHLSFFGYPRPTTPNLDRLLGESYVFTYAYTPSNKTIPSVASLFTGLQPTSCGVRGPFEAIPSSAPTLAEHFRSYGYRTAAFVANLIVTPQGGFAQGFETYFPRGAPWWTHRRRSAIEQIAQRARKQPDTKHAWRINRQFLDWLEGQLPSGEPLFAYLHYMEPHSPYRPAPEDLRAVAAGAPPGPSVPPLYQDYSDDEVCIDWECLATPVTLDEYARQGMVALYDGEIHAFDRHFGRLRERLDELGLLERAHLIFLTDHGEQFGEHDGWYHGHAIYDELILSPMAYRPPGGLARGVVIDRPVAMLDLLRTLMVRLGLEVPPLHQGREIPELLTGSRGGAVPRAEGSAPTEPAPAGHAAAQGGAVERTYPALFRQAVLSELPPQLYALRLGPWKLVRRGHPDHPQWRLFHIERDPGERTNLAAVEPDTLALLRSYLLATLAGLARQRLDLMETQLDPQTLQQLRDLGYIR